MVRAKKKIVMHRTIYTLFKNLQVNDGHPKNTSHHSIQRVSVYFWKHHNLMTF